MYLEVLEGMAGSRGPEPRLSWRASRDRHGQSPRGVASRGATRPDRRAGSSPVYAETIVTRAGLREKLARIREMGHATDIEEEALGCRRCGQDL